MAANRLKILKNLSIFSFLALHLYGGKPPKNPEKSFNFFFSCLTSIRRRFIAIYRRFLKGFTGF
jgi:hypothetical protein